MNSSRIEQIVRHFRENGLKLLLENPANAKRGDQNQGADGRRQRRSAASPLQRKLHAGAAASLNWLPRQETVQIIRQRMRHRHAHTIGIAPRVLHFKWRISQLHPDFQHSMGVRRRGHIRFGT